MLDFLSQPWPWYIAGPLIGLMVPLLLFFGNKHFGVSSSFRHLCSAVLPKKKPEYLKYDWKSYSWNLVMVLGVVIGAWIAATFLEGNQTPAISAKTKVLLAQWGVLDIQGILPQSLFAITSAFEFPNLILWIVGGFLIGFGTRYAGGCTSGHAIMGLSLLNLGSLVAVIGFFIGGLLMSHIILPWILGL